MGTDYQESFVADGEGPVRSVFVSPFNRYRVAARTGNTPDSSASNISFRCASDA